MRLVGNGVFVHAYYYPGDGEYALFHLFTYIPIDHHEGKITQGVKNVEVISHT